jgi:hypothetical protein
MLWPPGLKTKIYPLLTVFVRFRWQDYLTNTVLVVILARLRRIFLIGASAKGGMS